MCGFNPLHCGAVVASAAAREAEARLLLVSIPFIAGQWSLPSATDPTSTSPIVFQSPSLRGSGRFAAASLAVWRAWAGFNPLHCGAVVASAEAEERAKAEARFQSPSLRGSGRFSPPPHGGGARRRTFQSPSLRGSGRFRDPPAWAVRRDHWFQSPSLRGSGRFSRSPGSRMSCTRSCFNPLHCGAVVASCPESVPWSYIVQRFQSPSLRGSGRFVCSSSRRWRSPSRFNPLHCGAVVASPARAQAALGGFSVSIPFIAGQWSLRTPSPPEGVERGGI